MSTTSATSATQWEQGMQCSNVDNESNVGNENNNVGNESNVGNENNNVGNESNVGNKCDVTTDAMQ